MLLGLATPIVYFPAIVDDIISLLTTAEELSAI